MERLQMFGHVKRIVVNRIPRKEYKLCMGFEKWWKIDSH